jgi:hypothetical protein
METLRDEKTEFKGDRELRGIVVTLTTGIQIGTLTRPATAGGLPNPSILGRARQ